MANDKDVRDLVSGFSRRDIKLTQKHMDAKRKRVFADLDGDIDVGDTNENKKLTRLQQFVQDIAQKEQEKTRVVIADTKPYGNNMVAVAFGYANDITKQSDHVPLVEHPTGNYVILAPQTLDSFLENSNRDGDYPVFEAKLIKDNKDGKTAIPLLNTLEKPATPFDMEKHVANTPTKTKFVNRRLNTETRFDTSPTLDNTRKQERDLEL